MKRRVFLMRTAIAAGVVSSATMFTPLMAKETSLRKTSRVQKKLKRVKHVDSRTISYLRKAQEDKCLPKQALTVDSSQPEGIPILPMPLEERLKRNVVPRHGFCCILPGGEGLVSGNGAVNIEVAGNPYSERISFSHESLFMPRQKSLEAPKIANVLAQVRKMILDGKYSEAAMVGYNEWRKTNMARSGGMFGGQRFSLQLEFPKSASIKDYLRTVDFESTELKVLWTDERGEWVRRSFTSRPDNVVVHWLTAPTGQSVNTRIKMSESRGMGMRSLGRAVDGNSVQDKVQRDFNEHRLIIKGHLDTSVDNRGFANVTRVVREGGSAHVDGDTLVVENASSVLLLTRIEYLPDYSEEKVEAVWSSLEELNADYSKLLAKSRDVQAERLNRITVDFGDDSKFGLSAEELISDQQSSPGYSGTFLKTFFEMCRYWFIITTGKYRSVSALTNVNTNLQVAPISIGNYRESEMAYFEWIESLVPDFRNNAKNIYGMRGTLYPIAPTKDSGVSAMYDHADSTGETWPHAYWISAGGWVVRPFWDYYLTTGDLDFLRNRMVPIYKDLALFYEDYLTLTDKNGNYIFVPSFSPENNPGNLNPGCMAVVNATMDISVCREVLSNLVEACELLDIETDNISKWKAMIAKLPPYLFEPDGTLKEWAWDGLAERYNHRHISQGYGAWPGDEIDPDRTPELAKSLVIANRKRVPERLAAHSYCQRALIGSRLKDNYLVDSELRHLLEQGFVGNTMLCPHDPYANMRIPDAQGGIPAIIMEMLAYSRPGVIEVLPALPPTLNKGSINGMLLRTFARLEKLAWNMDDGTVDLTVTSLRKQDITLVARYGINEISVSSGALSSKPKVGDATCSLHLPEGAPVEIHLELGQRNTLDWINWIE